MGQRISIKINKWDWRLISSDSILNTVIYMRRLYARVRIRAIQPILADSLLALHQIPLVN